MVSKIREEKDSLLKLARSDLDTNLKIPTIDYQTVPPDDFATGLGGMDMACLACNNCKSVCVTGAITFRDCHRGFCVSLSGRTPLVHLLAGQAVAPRTAPEALDRAGRVFKFRAGALVHALAAEVDKGHQVKSFVRDFPPGRGMGEIGLPQFLGGKSRTKDFT